MSNRTPFHQRSFRRQIDAAREDEPTPREHITPIALDDLLGAQSRECILLAGKDGSGKSSALVSLAAMVGMMHPTARFFVIDTENKLRPVLQTYGPDVPRNLVYYKVENMNRATEALDTILDDCQPGDWLAVESMSRLWEKSQDLGYLAVTGLEKAAYLERRRAQMREGGRKPPPVTPRPDDFWSITKGAHDGAFLERISQHDTLNILLTTTIAKPPKEGRRESEDRQAIRREFGIDAGLEGAPRLPYYVQTLGLLEQQGGEIWCRILRDNLCTKDETSIEFRVENRKLWAPTFWAECRS